MREDKQQVRQDNMATVTCAAMKEMSVADTDKYKVIDLFCGCGGLSLGFRMAGFDVLHGYDNWQAALDVYNANLPDGADVLDLADFDATIAELGRWPHIDGIIGGPPCQDFSNAGQRVEGDRANLTRTYASVVSTIRPKFFVMENVPRSVHSNAYEHAMSVLEKAGYGISRYVMNASLVGVPQTRKRLITVGFLDANADDGFLGVLLANLSDRPTTLRDVFGDSLGTQYVYSPPRSYKRRAIYSIDEPFATIRGVCRPKAPGYRRLPNDAGPVEEARPLTTRERAIVQTFPADYEFFGSQTDQNQMIGNAVPVKLGEYVGRAVIEYLHAKETNKNEH